MSVQMACPKCRISSRLPASSVGKRVRCKRCREEFVATIQKQPPWLLLGLAGGVLLTLVVSLLVIFLLPGKRETGTQAVAVDHVKEPEQPKVDLESEKKELEKERQKLQAETKRLENERLKAEAQIVRKEEERQKRLEAEAARKAEAQKAALAKLVETNAVYVAAQKDVALLLDLARKARQAANAAVLVAERERLTANSNGKNPVYGFVDWENAKRVAEALAKKADEAEGKYRHATLAVVDAQAAVRQAEIAVELTR